MGKNIAAEALLTMVAELLDIEKERLDDVKKELELSIPNNTKETE